MLQNLSNLVCLGDDFRRFSHPNAQNLAQSQNSQIMCWTCSAPRLGSASISLSPCSCLVVRFPGDQRWGWQEKRARRRFLCCAFVSGGLGIAFLRGSARGRSSKVFPGGSPRVGAGLSALLCHWGRWRPARAGGNDGKGRTASEFGDSCASLLGAHPRS